MNRDLKKLISFGVIVLALFLFGLITKFKEQIIHYGRIFLIIVLSGICVLAVILIFIKSINIFQKIRHYFKKKKGNEIFLKKINDEKNIKQTKKQDVKKYYCERCHEEISEEVNNFSQKNFNKPLCRKHQPTREARKLGHLLKNYYNWDIEFEKFDDHKHIDIAIDEAKTYIEVEGQHHAYSKTQALADLKRDSYSLEDQFITIRIQNCLIKDYTTRKETAKLLNMRLKKRCSQLSATT